MSKSVDCNNCSAKFQNFKLYIQHLIGQRCRKDSMVQNTKTSPKRKSEEPAGNVSKSVKMTITEAIIPQQNKSQAVNVKNGKARCEFCMRMIKPRGMTQHLNIVHKCKHCDQLVESIDDHIQAAHAQEPCPHCTKLFVSKDKVDHARSEKSSTQEKKRRRRDNKPRRRARNAEERSKPQVEGTQPITRNPRSRARDRNPMSRGRDTPWSMVL